MRNDKRMISEDRPPVTRKIKSSAVNWVIYKLSLFPAWFNVDLTPLATRRRLSKVQSFKLIYDCSHECMPNRFGSPQYLTGLKVDNYRFLDLSFAALAIAGSVTEKHARLTVIRDSRPWKIFNRHVLVILQRNNEKARVCLIDAQAGSRRSSGLWASSRIHGSLLAGQITAITFRSPCTSVFLFEHTSTCLMFLFRAHIGPVHVHGALAYTCARTPGTVMNRVASSRARSYSCKLRAHPHKCVCTCTAKRARRCTRRHGTRRGSRRGQINETHASSGSQVREVREESVRDYSSSISKWISDILPRNERETAFVKVSHVKFGRNVPKFIWKRIITLALGYIHLEIYDLIIYPFQRWILSFLSLHVQH